MSLKALVIKLIAVAGLSAIVIPMLTALGVGSSLVFGLMLAIAAYLIGDWLILNYLGNFIATLADLGLAAIALKWYGGTIRNSGVTWGDALVFGVLVAVFEWFFHNYLNRAEKTSRRQRA